MQIVPEGRLALSLQLPVQAQSTIFVADWEKTAGPDEILAVARAADESGFFTVGACDHIAIPPERAKTMSTHWSDPIAVLSMVAAVTSRVRLMTYVYVLALRHPLMAAKSMATLDHLSKGRLVIGVGAGHVAEEFEALGVDYSARGPLLDDAIDGLDVALRHEWPELTGRYAARDLGQRPRPVQEPRPPIWVGGSTPPAIRRAARKADGWLPQGPATPDLIAALQEERERVRPGEPITVGHVAGLVYVGTPSWELPPGTMTGTPSQVAEQVLARTAAGTHLVQLIPRGRRCDEVCDQVRAIGTEVGPLLVR